MATAVAKNGQVELEGRTLRVDASAGRGGGAGTPGNRGGNNNSDGTTIFVKGFDTSGTTSDTACYWTSHGQVHGQLMDNIMSQGYASELPGPGL